MTREYIYANKVIRKRLEVLFNINQSNVSRSLNLSLNSIKARSIRVYAVNKLFCKLHINKKTII